MTETLIQLMEKLNFGRPVAIVYNNLLSSGPLSPADLARAARQHSKDLDQVVKLLLQFHLIGEDYYKGRKRYYARNPTIAWQALESDLVWSTHNTLEPVRLSPNTGDPEVEVFRSICVQIVDLAQPLYKPHVAAVMHRERDAETQDELARLTCEIIFEAQTTIQAVSKSPTLPQLSQFWTVLTERIKKGVFYHRIADLQEVIDHGLAVKARDMNDYQIDLRIMEGDHIKQTFYIVDGRYLSVAHQEGESDEEKRRGIGRITTQNQILRRYKKQFREYLEHSIPGSFVIDHMKAAASQLIQRATAVFSSEEIQWLVSLVDYGHFSKHPEEQNWPQTKTEQVQEKAANAGLITRNHYGRIVPAYPTNERELRRAHNSARV